MSWKARIVLFISSILIILFVNIFTTNMFVHFIVAFIVIYVSYIIWYMITDKLLCDILDEKCDPLAFIEKVRKKMLLSNKTAFQNRCNVNLSIAFISLGRFDEAYRILQNIDQDTMSFRLIETAYNSCLINYYMNNGDIDKISLFIDRIKDSRKRTIQPRLIFCIDAIVLGYNYMLNKTPETAKYYLEQLDYLYKSYAKKLKKRQRLGVLFTRASLMQELGDYEEAAKRYKIVIENGNGLYLVKMCQDRLSELEKSLKNLKNLVNE